MRSRCSLGSPFWKVSGLRLPPPQACNPLALPDSAVIGEFPLSVPRSGSLPPGTLSKEPLCLAPDLSESPPEPFTCWGRWTGR